jgi:ubiquinone/menaquinone biosynthesis C-methylase UbiE
MISDPMKKPKIWHYGLLTRYWSAFTTEGGPELQFYQDLIEANGQPALDLGCGSGRLLVPLL